MRDYVDIGPCPCEEDCVALDPNKDNLPAMRAECLRFIAAIRLKLGVEPGSARLKVKSNAHDFGTYLEVVCYYDDTDEEGMDYAFRCESDAPATWDDTRDAADASDEFLAKPMTADEQSYADLAASGGIVDAP